jgi:hypothetical protein
MAPPNDNRKGTPMINLVDFILDLFRNPVEAQRFIDDPGQALDDAGLTNVSAAQINAVTATTAPSLALSNDDPLGVLQRAVADHHNILTDIAPQRVSAPETKTDLLSADTRALSPHGSTDTGVDLASQNVQGDVPDLGSPDLSNDGTVGTLAELGDPVSDGGLPDLSDDGTVNDGVGLADHGTIGVGEEFPAGDLHFSTPEDSADIWSESSVDDNLADQTLDTSIDVGNDVGIL